VNRNRIQSAELITALLLLALALPLCAQRAAAPSSNDILSGVVRDNLRLAAGTRTVLNMTLSTLFTPSEWLPAERRPANEPADDWQWTLRSTMSRPLLR